MVWGDLLIVNTILDTFNRMIFTEGFLLLSGLGFFIRIQTKVNYSFFIESV